MAQAKRKRTRKHRGTAAGTIDVEGYTPLCAPGGTRETLKACVNLSLPMMATIGGRYIVPMYHPAAALLFAVFMADPATVNVAYGQLPHPAIEDTLIRPTQQFDVTRFGTDVKEARIDGTR